MDSQLLWRCYDEIGIINNKTDAWKIDVNLLISQLWCLPFLNTTCTLIPSWRSPGKRKSELGRETARTAIFRLRCFPVQTQWQFLQHFLEWFLWPIKRTNRGTLLNYTFIPMLRSLAKFLTRAIIYTGRQKRYRNDVNSPSCRINTCQRAFYITGVKTWNNLILSKDLRGTTNTKTFNFTYLLLYIAFFNN